MITNYQMFSCHSSSHQLNYHTAAHVNNDNNQIGMAVYVLYGLLDVIYLCRSNSFVNKYEEIFIKKNKE